MRRRERYESHNGPTANATRAARGLRNIVSTQQGAASKKRQQAEILSKHLGRFWGRIKEGETPREAACRELEEELGISIEPSSLAFQGSIRVFREPDRQPVVHYYSTSLIGNLCELAEGGRGCLVQRRGNPLSKAASGRSKGAGAALSEPGL